MKIYDNIHGYIDIDLLASTIINTPVFQRLREIHQTGVLYLVFPTANHSRFEHSIGTYHLAKQMISNIAKKQPELQITVEIIELVSIAGLCHDLGHLLFSHLFDDYFLKSLPNYADLKILTKNTCHENRSIYLLNYLIDTYSIQLNNSQLKVIGDLINPDKNEYGKWETKYQIGKWLFQIVSNPLNSIDVDKFDYITRDTHAVGLKLGFDYSRIINDAKVINDNICYSSQCSEDIYHMFFIRYRLHRQIYNHKAAKAIEILIVKLLFEIEKEHKISEYILDPVKMLKLVDSFIWHQKSNNLIETIIQNINQRILPKLIYQNISLSKYEIDENKLQQTFGSSSYYIVRFKVGYVSGNSNPLNKIIFYNLKTGEIISNNKVKTFSLLITQKYQEYFLRIYCLNLSQIQDFYNYFDKLSDKNTLIEDKNTLIEDKNTLTNENNIN